MGAWNCRAARIFNDGGGGVAAPAAAHPGDGRGVEGRGGGGAGTRADSRGVGAVPRSICWSRGRGVPAWRPAQVPVHVEVETGMARQGVTVAELPKLLARLKPETGTALKFEGLHTHYASAEDHAGDQNQRQTSRFCQAGLAARKADMWPRYLHGGNSSTLASEDGTLQRLHELARGLGAHLLVRPGLGLFGYLLRERLRIGQEKSAALAAELQPVLA